ncbi:exonuclease subunit SbcD [Shewanella sp. NIFS-20-20]|uniref:exonuclease subunit SbcD n=1 Tax=Shewanella sp. NIFS-20-20 TaxID=2853806 RepID=UPI001C469118|nr:exonuclease subunit SbcD [Shewanella sp. NIFS-20-20]MBV7315183.1 exonuclease subunit SbcD [Shewanella sp. NIFS-20-20]
MRVLHTSDWHLGQSFYGKSRFEEHQAFLKWLLEQVREQAIDAVIIAGDIFDTGTPPSYARALYNQFVVQMQQLSCPVFILGGNHDSVAMLAESQSLLSCLNTYVVPCGCEPQDATFIIHDKSGAPGLVLAAVPYLRPRDIMRSEAGQSGLDKQQQLGLAIADYYQHHYDYALAKAQQLGALAPLPVVMTGHLTTVGASSSESVREIYIGSLDAFNAKAFPPASYVALGHIHRGQLVAGSEHIRYSGSPIPLSFDELGRGKQVLIAHFDGQSLERVVSVAVPLFQKLAVIKGQLAEVEVELNKLVAMDESVWVSVVLSSDELISDLQQRLQAQVTDSKVQVLQIKRQRSVRQLTALDTQETLSELSIDEVFQRRLANEPYSDNEQARLTTLFTQVAVAAMETPLA